MGDDFYFIYTQPVTGTVTPGAKMTYTLGQKNRAWESADNHPWLEWWWYSDRAVPNPDKSIPATRVDSAYAKWAAEIEWSDDCGDYTVLCIFHRGQDKTYYHYQQKIEPVDLCLARELRLARAEKPIDPNTALL